MSYLKAAGSNLNRVYKSDRYTPELMHSTFPPVYLKYIIYYVSNSNK